MNSLFVVSVCFIGSMVLSAPASQLSRQKRQYGNQYQEEMQNAYREAEQRYEQEQQDAYIAAEEQYEQQVQDEYQREVDEYNQQQQAAQDAYVQQEEEMARQAAERNYGGGYRYGRSTRQKRSIPQNQMYSALPVAVSPQHYPQTYPVNMAARQYPSTVAVAHPFVQAQQVYPIVQTQQQTYPVSSPQHYPVSQQVPIYSTVQSQQTNPTVKQYSCLDFLDMIFRLLLQDRVDALGAQLLAATVEYNDYYDYDDDDYQFDDGSVDFIWDTTEQPTTVKTTTVTNSETVSSA